VTLDVNVKFNSKPTFINIVYAYSQPFWRNFDFLSKILFFFIKQLFYLNLLEICKLQSSYMFKVALATTVCYDKSCINYKKLEIKTLQVMDPLR
jgi:hypothetical protein